MMDFLVVGAGIFGVCTAMALTERGHKVGLLNANEIPDPLAASTDISKVVRMEYGSDEEYMHMAIQSMSEWRLVNKLVGEDLYHEVGYLLLTGKEMTVDKQPYEWYSFENVLNAGFSPQRINSANLAMRFPAWAHDRYKDGFFHEVGGFALSGKAVKLLAKYLVARGVEVKESTPAREFLRESSRVVGVVTNKGEKITAGHVIVCAGNHTPVLLPELKPFMKITGHPVFHLKPRDPTLYLPECFPVFAADIAQTGFYGFPLHPTEGVVKIALHTEGLELDPVKDERVVFQEDIDRLRSFLRSSLPGLAEAPVVYTRRCCYTDTLDGHFWIDRHPQYDGLTVGSGGSGHGFKMGPVVGEMIASVAEGKSHKWSDRYRWRSLSAETVQKEEARYLANRKL